MRTYLLLSVLAAGCGSKGEHCKPAAATHGKLLSAVLGTWGADAPALAKFEEEFVTLQCADTKASNASLDCIRDATSLAAVDKCVGDMGEGAGDWQYRTEAARTLVTVKAIPELDAFRDRLVAGARAAQEPPPNSMPMRCPEAIKHLHFLDFRLVAALAAKKDPPVGGTDVLGDRALEELLDFFVNPKRDAQGGWLLRKWVGENAGASLALIHVASLVRPELNSSDLAAGTFAPGSLDAAISVVDDKSAVVCRVPVFAASSASIGFAWDQNSQSRESVAASRVQGDFDQKIPDALARARATLLGL